MQLLRVFPFGFICERPCVGLTERGARSKVGVTWNRPCRVGAGIKGGYWSRSSSQSHSQRTATASTDMPELSTPLTLGPTTLRNRNTMSALTRNRAVPRDVPNDVMLEYYTQRAKGGAGLIVTEGTLISRQGTEWPYAPGIWNDDHVKGWKKITKSVHDAGGRIFCQLWHLGRVNHPDMPEQKASGQPVWGPSAISARGGKFRSLPGKPGYVTPTPIPDPWVIIEEYRNAALKAKEAGFDGVELHGANGYLVQQFLDLTANTRTDKWGGSVENRARFCLEAAKVLIDVWGADRVGVKLNPAGGYNDMGMSLKDTVETYSYVTSALNDLKVVYITLSRYVAAMDPTFDGKTRATQHDVLETYRPFIKHPKLILNGGLTPSEADELIRKGAIDAAAFGFLWIGHPDMQHRVETGKALDAVVDVKNLYHQPGVELPVGYTNYPAAS
ncbi:FMN-linked oxidoreductase [Gautieria morchelliformis]|nr:FMN-linked oxidoreductase [Gautieria morchelliformis]